MIISAIHDKALPFEKGWEKGLLEYGKTVFQYGAVCIVNLALLGLLYLSIHYTETFALTTVTMVALCLSAYTYYRLDFMAELVSNAALSRFERWALFGYSTSFAGRLATWSATLGAKRYSQQPELKEWESELSKLDVITRDRIVHVLIMYERVEIDLEQRRDIDRQTASDLRKLLYLDSLVLLEILKLQQIKPDLISGLMAKFSERVGSSLQADK